MKYRNDESPETLPDPWLSKLTGQLFTPFGRWEKPGVELIDWTTSCRRCGTQHYFVLRADYPDKFVTEMCNRWHGLCHGCRKGSGR